MNPPALDGKPPRLPFREVDQAWAISVARILLWSRDALPDLHLEIDEYWLTAEFALYLRHVRGDTKLGIRFGELGINPHHGDAADRLGAGGGLPLLDDLRHAAAPGVDG